MARLNLNPNPTFKATVEICRPGLENEKIEIEFKHRTRDQMNDLIKQMVDMDIEDQVMAVASGWDLVDTFNLENVKLLAQNYISAPMAIRDKYIAELIKAKEKN
jgi:hypothetical protein